MSIVESDGPPSWSPDASETGESTKCPWVGEMGLKARGWGSGKIFSRPPCSPPLLPTGNLYPRQFRKRQETKMAARRTQRPTSAGSHGKIGDCEQSIDRRTVCKKTLLETWFSLRSCAKPEHPIRSLTFLETNHFSQSKLINVLQYLLIQTPK